jgi:alpha-glucosidase
MSTSGPCRVLFLLVAMWSGVGLAEEPLTLASPDGKIGVAFRVTERGEAAFEVTRGEAALVAGRLGLEFAGAGPLREGLKVTGSRGAQKDETYAIAVGKASSARDRHDELTVWLEEAAAPGRKLEVEFRAFDDGIAFRYRIPAQERRGEFAITDEQTRLSFPGDPRARLLPLRGYTTPYEWYYESRRASEIGSDVLVGLPMLLEHPGGTWFAVTEADLTDYAGMYLSGVAGEPGTLVSKLSPLPGRADGAKVVGKVPFESPWRVVMIADDPGRLIESNLVFHLNDPCAIEDTSWIRPGKTTFPWWNHFVLEGVGFEPGVNTATTKHYIDFCAEHGIPYHSLDGLDIAWYGGPIQPAGPTDVTKAAPSIDLPEVLRHAKEKGVRLRLWMHWKALQPQLDEAFATYEKWGIEGVMIDFMDRDDQEMVRWYHEVAEKAARHHLTVTWHGAYKPTGMERTWPNVLTYEAVLNQEYNKWQPPGVKGTPPEHNLDVAFVRMLAGPLDYHQGGMRNVLPEEYAFRDVAPPVQGTRAHQLAMYVVYQNHLPMVADYPQAYRGQAGFEFLVDVPTNWDETRVLKAELGECIVVARRKAEEWWIGGMADEGCEVSLGLGFLGPGGFVAECYRDDPVRGATGVRRTDDRVIAGDRLPAVMSRGGGFAARVRAIGR